MFFGGDEMGLKVWKNRSVVIVDDSKLIRDDLRIKLETLELRVVGEAGNGLSGLEQISKHNPDIVCLDVIMPEMNGIECYRAISAKYPNIKCFFVSCLATDQKVRDSLKDIIKLDDFLSKPADPAALEAFLKREFANKQEHGQEMADLALAS